MKYVINKKTGKRYCLHCSSYECICLPEIEGYFNFEYAIELEVKKRYDYTSGLSNKFWFYKQKLPNGRIIKGSAELVIPNGKWCPGKYRERMSIFVSNDIINKSFH